MTGAAAGSPAAALGEFTFLRPDGSEIPDRLELVEGSAEAIEVTNRRLNLTITDTTGIPDWDGLPPDYSWAIEVLHHVSAETPRR